MYHNKAKSISITWLNIKSEKNTFQALWSSEERQRKRAGATTQQACL